VHAADEVVADAQRAVLHEHRRHRALARIELRLDHRARWRAVGVGLEVQDLGLQEDLLEQLVDVRALLGRDLGREHVAAELLQHDAVLQQLLLDLAGLACGRSTLLIATTIGTPAFLACEIASMVCGITRRRPPPRARRCR
jgi:hypothetical protein